MPSSPIHRPGLRLAALFAGGVVTAGAALLAYARTIEPSRLEIVPHDVILPRLAGCFDGYRLAQISDIHLGTGVTPARLHQVVDRVNALSPDLVAITGDFITHGPVEHYASDLSAALGRLSAPDGVVAVLGNHDHWADPQALRVVFHQSGLRDLSNAVHTLRRGAAMLHLAGLDCVCERHHRLDQVLSALPDEGSAILLVHEPDYADVSAEAGRFDLQLSGHSHGGQVALPFLRRPPILPRLGMKYPLGRYQVGAMIHYTNRGIGTIPPSVRFNCPPEIALFTLRAPDT